MSTSSTAALLSALVFPGTGQIYLKRIARGLAYIVPTAFSASILFSSMFDRAQDLLTRIESGSLPLTTDALMVAVAQQGDPGWLPTLAGWVMLGCWIASTVDAWLLGRPGNSS
jgi:hypothetical protein